MRRRIINAIAATIVMVGGLSLGGGAAIGPQQAWAQGGGTCCDDPQATCYIFHGTQVIIQPDAYYSSGSC